MQTIGGNIVKETILLYWKGQRGGETWEIGIKKIVHKLSFSGKRQKKIPQQEKQKEKQDKSIGIKTRLRIRNWCAVC